jgi:hypothetical protein
MQPDRRNKVKSRILPSLVRILLVISFTPALCWAQAEISPDHFDSVKSVSAVARKATSQRNPAQAYGSVFLPFDVQCAGVTLTPGYYSLSIRQLGKQDVVKLTPIANAVHAHSLEVIATPRLSPEAPSQLRVDRMNRRRMLTAISLEEPGVTLFLQAGKEPGDGKDTKLIPISTSASRAFMAGGN